MKFFRVVLLLSWLSVAALATGQSPDPDLHSHKPAVCKTTTSFESSEAPSIQSVSSPKNSFLVRFRIAVSASGEYTQFHGGTVEKAMEAIKQTLANLNEVYRRDLGIILELVPGNEAVVFTNGQTDPFTSRQANQTTLEQNQNVLNERIGSQNYDLGILFDTFEFGLTYPKSVGDPQIKGKSCIGSSFPVGPKFDYSYVSHEIAHMFGANHTFNSPLEHCSQFRSDVTAYEPGSGSTIMAYAGLGCGNDNVQDFADSYFHTFNIFEIRSFVARLSAGTRVGVENTAPSAEAVSKIYVPQNTSFELRGFASDDDPINRLTYSWEQLDLGLPRSFSDLYPGTGPIVKSSAPSSNSQRWIPSPEAVLAGRIRPWDDFLKVPGKYKFRLTVRDNHPVAGEVAFSNTEVEVVAGTGPFQILMPTNATLASAESLFIQWAVNGTDQSPILASKVQILLSTNDGISFDSVLVAETANDGEEIVIVPSMVCAKARFKIAALGKSFFTISNTSFSIDFQMPIIRLKPAPGKHVLSWVGVPGKKYLVEATEAPGKFWDVVSTPLEGSERMSWEEIAAQHPQRIFRIRIAE